APACVTSVSRMSGKREGESRDGVALTNLDQPLFDGADASKRDLIDYLDGVRDRIIPELEGRPLSVIRIHRGQEAFMQKNVPKYTPDWVRTVQFWAETSKREVTYALCDDRRTLLWFANQRAVEYHPTAARAERLDPETATTAFMKEDRGGKVFVDSTRVGGATVVAAYSPRLRPGVPVSFPVSWDDLDDITPADFTVHTALRQLGDRDPW